MKLLWKRKERTATGRLPGVGPKVADCIALFALKQHQAVPVDVHVWRIVTRDYEPSLREAGNCNASRCSESNVFRGQVPDDGGLRASWACLSKSLWQFRRLGAFVALWRRIWGLESQTTSRDAGGDAALRSERRLAQGARSLRSQAAKRRSLKKSKQILRKSSKRAWK